MLKIPRRLPLLEEMAAGPKIKEWFGSSKVVDESGEPLLVWHGGKVKAGPEGGIFFTRDEQLAAAYSKGGELHCGFLKMDNPFIKDFSGERSYEFYDEIEEAVDGGYDGVILMNVEDHESGKPETQYVIFSEGQLMEVER